MVVQLMETFPSWTPKPYDSIEPSSDHNTSIRQLWMEDCSVNEAGVQAGCDCLGPLLMGRKCSRGVHSPSLRCVIGRSRDDCIARGGPVEIMDEIMVTSVGKQLRTTITVVQ